MKEIENGPFLFPEVSRVSFSRFRLYVSVRRKLKRVGQSIKYVFFVVEEGNNAFKESLVTLQGKLNG